MRTTLEHTSMLDSPKVNKCTEVNIWASHLGNLAHRYKS